ncbi:MAG: hypothetical protein COA75_13175 [Cellvibrionales bacterium]|nr:MAG: hypothetical protein COA75_13175 [Cellvibrionales bacterium]
MAGQLATATPLKHTAYFRGKAITKGLFQHMSQHLQVIEQVEDTLWACDLNLNLTYLSPLTEKNSAYSVEDRKQLDITKILTPASIRTIRALLEKYASTISPLEEPGIPIRCRVDIYHRDGSTYPAEASISFILNDKGMLTSI